MSAKTVSQSCVLYATGTAHQPHTVGLRAPVPCYSGLSWRTVLVAWCGRSTFKGLAMGFTKTTGIYGIYCRATGKWYVGAGVDVERRIKYHFYAMKTWPNEKEMSRDAQRYGIKSMEAKILEVVSDQSELQAREAYWIERLGAMQGYNLQASGNNRFWSR